MVSSLLLYIQYQDHPTNKTRLGSLKGGLNSGNLLYLDRNGLENGVDPDQIAQQFDQGLHHLLFSIFACLSQRLRISYSSYFLAVLFLSVHISANFSKTTWLICVKFNGKLPQGLWKPRAL